MTFSLIQTSLFQPNSTKTLLLPFKRSPHLCTYYMATLSLIIKSLEQQILVSIKPFQEWSLKSVDHRNSVSRQTKNNILTSVVFQPQAHESGTILPIIPSGNQTDIRNCYHGLLLLTLAPPIPQSVEPTTSTLLVTMINNFLALLSIPRWCLWGTGYRALAHLDFLHAWHHFLK